MPDHAQPQPSQTQPSQPRPSQPWPFPPPALREAHAHIPMLGWEMAWLHLDDCATMADALDRIAARAAAMRADRATPPNAWLIACGTRPQAWTDRPGSWPTRAQLARACPDRPCLVMSFDHHSAAVDPRAFEAAGFHDGSPDPEGGVIERDATGAPTGLLLEAAFSKARAAIPQPTPEQWVDLIARALGLLRNLGFVEVHDLLSPPELGPILARLDDAGALPCAVRLYAPWKELPQRVAEARACSRPRVVLAGGKLFADGTLNAATAWMLEPYLDGLPGHPHGQALTTPAQLDEALAMTRSLGLELAVHAIGDGAVRACLDAFERASLRAGGSTGGVGPNSGTPRLRIEHAELIAPTDVPRFVRPGLTCSVQPCHLLYDIEALHRRVGDRLDRVLPLRSLIRAGLVPGSTLVFGSDVPIVRADPQDSIIAAVERRRTGSTPGGAACSPIAPHEALTPDEAWRAFSPEPT